MDKLAKMLLIGPRLFLLVSLSSVVGAGFCGCADEVADDARLGGSMNASPGANADGEAPVSIAPYQPFEIDVAGCSDPLDLLPDGYIVGDRGKCRGAARVGTCLGVGGTFVFWEGQPKLFLKQRGPCLYLATTAEGPWRLYALDATTEEGRTLLAETEPNDAPSIVTVGGDLAEVLPQLKEIQVKWLVLDTIRNTHRVSELPSVTGIVWRHAAPTEALESLAKLPHLSTFAYGNELPRRLDPFAELRGLEQLYITQRAGFTDLRPLSKLSNLRVLRLMCGPLPDQSVLKELPELTCLTLYQREGAVDTATLSGLKNLRVLNLSSCPELHDISFLEEMPQLLHLGLGGCRNISDFSPLANLNNLTSLNLTLCSGLKSLDVIAGLPHLETLDTTYCANIEDIGTLKSVRTLQELKLSSKSMTDLNALPYLPNLRSLHLIRFPELTDITALEKFDSLENLKFRSCGKLVDIGPIGRLKNLEAVQLDTYSDLRDVTPLVNLPRLRAITLSVEDDVTDLRPLAQMKQLQSITVYGYGQETLDQLEELRKALPDCNVGGSLR